MAKICIIFINRHPKIIPSGVSIYPFFGGRNANSVCTY